MDNIEVCPEENFPGIIRDNNQTECKPLYHKNMDEISRKYWKRENNISFAIKLMLTLLCTVILLLIGLLIYLAIPKAAAEFCPTKGEVYIQVSPHKI